MSQHIFWHLTYCQATKAHASLHKCAGSPEPLLLVYTKETAWAFKGGVCPYVINTKFLCTGPYDEIQPLEKYICIL